MRDKQDQHGGDDTIERFQRYFCHPIDTQRMTDRCSQILGMTPVTAKISEKSKKHTPDWMNSPERISGKQHRAFASAFIAQDDIDQVQCAKTGQEAEERNIGIAQQQDVNDYDRDNCEAEQPHVQIARHQGRYDD